MLVHLCKSIHYNQLHEYSKVVFNTFGTVSFICFSPLIHFFFIVGCSFRTISFIRLGHENLFETIYCSCISMLLVAITWHAKKNNIYFTHSQMHHTAPSIDSWFILHYIALPCILINRFWLQIKQKSNYSSVYTVSTLHPRSVCQ